MGHFECQIVSGSYIIYYNDLKNDTLIEPIVLRFQCKGYFLWGQ